MKTATDAVKQQKEQNFSFVVVLADALWDLPDSFNMTGPKNTAGIFATYPGKHLTIVNGFFDQVCSILTSRRHKHPTRGFTSISSPALHRSSELPRLSFASWLSWIRTTTLSLRDWRPSLLALWFWSLACLWALTLATLSTPPGTSAHESSQRWQAGEPVSSRRSTNMLISYVSNPSG